jgi:hypothetical protein
MGNPDTGPTDSTFGQINGGTGSDVATPREIQGALKFTF